MAQTSFDVILWRVHTVAKFMSSGKRAFALRPDLERGAAMHWTSKFRNYTISLSLGAAALAAVSQTPQKTQQTLHRQHNLDSIRTAGVVGVTPSSTRSIRAAFRTRRRRASATLKASPRGSTTARPRHRTQSDHACILRRASPAYDISDYRRSPGLRHHGDFAISSPKPKNAIIGHHGLRS